MKGNKAKWVKIISISALVLLGGAFALNGWALNPKGEKDGVLATVDGVRITQGEVDERMSAMLGPQAAMLPPEKLTEIRQELKGKVLDSLIVETLLTNAVEKAHVTVGDVEINKVMAKLKASLPSGMAFEEYLKGVGLTEMELKETLQRSLRIQKLVEQQVTGIAAPVEAEITAYYKAHPSDFETPEGIEVRHILIGVTQEDTDAIKADKMKKAQEVREQVVAGKDFETLAAEVSDCPSKANGGRLGVLSRGQTVKPFEEAAFSRNMGEIGPVVETRFGYHVIEVLDHKDAGKATLAEVKESIAQHLTQQKKEQAVQAYIDSLKAAATIVFPTNNSPATDPA